MADFTYKYQVQLDALKEAGFDMPTVSLPEGKQASRFVFANKPKRNHLHYENIKWNVNRFRLV